MSAGQISVLQTRVHSVNHKQYPSFWFNHTFYELTQTNLYLAFAYIPSYQLVTEYLLCLSKDLFLVFLVPFTSLVTHLHYIEVVDYLLTNRRSIFFGSFGLFWRYFIEYLNFAVRLVLGSLFLFTF